MADAGYVRIYRTLLGHHAFRNDAEALAFAWMVVRASWKPAKVRYKGIAVTLKRGQLVVSVRDLAERLDRPKGWIERVLTRLKSGTMIKTSSETGLTIITICNYNYYQADLEAYGTAAGTVAGTPTGQRRDTEQRREEVKKKIDSQANACVPLGADQNDGGLFGDDAPAKPARPVPDQFVEIWNELAIRIGRPTIKALTGSRSQTLKARLAQFKPTDFHDVFAKIERSDFLAGRTQRWGGVTFDWVIKQENFIKILEGNYDR